MLLVDTNALIWFSNGDARLGFQARQVIADGFGSRNLAVSSISFWEMTMFTQKGRVTIAKDIEAWRHQLLADGIVEIVVDGVIATRAGLLQDIPGDPADRFILATAILGNHTLVTSDRRLLDWPGAAQRIDART